MNFDSSSLVQAQQLVVAQSGPIALQPHARGINKFPNELVMEVFEYSVLPDRQDPAWWTSLQRAGEYDTATRASILACVCNSWRSIALKMPNLWSVIRVPSKIWQLDDQAACRLLEVLQTLIGRSGGKPLSFLLPWDIPGVEWPARKTEVPRAAWLALEELCTHAHRWQRLEFQAPAEGARPDVLDLLFGRPTPCLEYVRVSSEHRVLEKRRPRIYTHTHDGLLPASPRLEMAYLGVDLFFPSGASVAALVHLCVDSPLAHGKLFDILPHTPALETLCLRLTDTKMAGDMEVAHDAMIASPIFLASLKRLEVQSHMMAKPLRHLARYTRMPNLSELCLAHRILWDQKRVPSVLGFIAVNGNALTSLTVCEDTEQHVYMNPAFAGVDTFWESLARDTPQLAPRLRKLSMLDIVDIPGPRGSQTYNAFKDARNDPELNAVAPLEVTERWAELAVVVPKPIARGRPGTGLLTGRRTWPSG